MAQTTTVTGSQPSAEPGFAASAWAALTSDTGVLVLIAFSVFVLHMALGSRYGYHRDELAVIDYSRTLAWGYIEFPPMTPFLVRLATLFDDSLRMIRVPGAIAAAIVVFLAGMIARDLGGKRAAQVLAAGAVWVSPVGLLAGSMVLYATFDYLWWVCVAWAVGRVARTQNPRWWLAVGAFVGLGLMTKYTMVVLAIGVVVGVLLSPLRRDLRSGWLWAGVGLAALIVLPNLIWQVQHDFIAIEFTRTIHARDVAWGRTEDFFPMQFLTNANPLLMLLWMAGLVWLFAAKSARRFMALAWMFVVPLAIFWWLEGRSYYMAAPYVWLCSAGAVAWEAGVGRLSTGWARAAKWGTAALVVVGGLLAIGISTPAAPIHSAVWEVQSEVHDIFREQLLWPELVDATAAVYTGLPPEEQALTGIFAGNYGEAGAINILGADKGLPTAISATNQYWLRGFGDPPPQQVIVLGESPASISRWFSDCSYAGRLDNPQQIENEEAEYAGMYLCRHINRPWQEMWPEMQEFG